MFQLKGNNGLLDEGCCALRSIGVTLLEGWVSRERLDMGGSLRNAKCCRLSV